MKHKGATPYQKNYCMQGSCWCYCKSHIYRRKPKAGTEEFERTRAARSIAEAILAKLVV